MTSVERGRSFDAWAGEYDRYRPSYPEPPFALRHGLTGETPFTIPYRIDCWTARRSSS